MAEIEIQRAIIQYLQFLENKGEAYFIRANSFAGKFTRGNGSIGWIKNNKPGCPDIIVCYYGKFIGLEVKTPLGKQSDYQKIAQKMIENSKGYYAIVHKVGDVVDILRIVKKCYNNKNNHI